MKKHRLLITLLLTVIAIQAAFSGDKIRVMGQNVENFFYLTTEQSTDPNHVFTQEQREAKMDAILKAYFREGIPVADIYCFNEIECSDDILNYIATSFSTKTGKSFTYVQDGLATYDNSGNIIRKSGFVYNKDVVKPYGSSMPTGTGQVYSRFMRMQTFEEIASGKRFTVSMNHFKAGDVGVVNSENSNRRAENATDLLQALPNALDPDILVMGDMNSYYNKTVKEPCLQMLIDAGYEEQLYRFNPNAYAAGWGVGNFIDHVFANSTMAEQITDTKFYYVATTSSQDVITAYSDHDPYMVEIELTKENVDFTFTKATEVKIGGQYLMAATFNGKLEVAKPIVTTATKDYDYIYTETVTEDNGIITLTNMNNAFTFEDAGDGKFYIKDSQGRYAAQTSKSGGGWYTTMRVVSNKSDAHKYTATKQSDGAFKLLSETGYYLYGKVYNNTTPEFMYGNSATLYSGNYFPFLYEYSATPTAISTVNAYSQPTTTRKVMENGRLVIINADGKRYSLQGIGIK